jgi:hypothetical protein
MKISVIFPVQASFLLLSFLIQSATGQDSVKGTQSADKTLLGELILKPSVTGVIINSVSLTGDPKQVGTYEKTGNLFPGLPSTGVVLSSGSVANVEEGKLPNTSFGNDGDADLERELKLLDSGVVTKDAAVLVFDVDVTTAVDITVAYVFGSNNNPASNAEYPDAFGLFVEDTNVALIGGKIVSLRCIGANCNEFNDNSAGVGTSLAYYTKMQTVTLNLPVGASQKLKIAVVDGSVTSDSTQDGVVFLSFLSPPTRSPTKSPTGSPTMKPTQSPTKSPTGSPTVKPTKSPTGNPTMKPMRKPTMKPTGNPVLPPMNVQIPVKPPMMSQKMTSIRKKMGMMA